MNPTQDFEIIDIGEDNHVAPAEIPTREPSPCPGLDSMLTQVFQSPEPIKQAQQLKIPTKGEKIQVMLILAGGETSFLEDYSVEVSKQSGTQAQAFVPIEQLCALTNHEDVLAIRTITQIIID
ncbi:MAG: hypothetical protein PVF74_04415 [Anaerolineales bacterium]